MSEASTASTKNTSKKVKALMAGGVVLGIGAAVTLASWTDQEWAPASFHSGAFGIESSVTGQPDSFKATTNATEAATLQFDLPESQTIAPNETIAAPFALRLDTDTTIGANVKLLAASSTENANFKNLSYGITQVTNAKDCYPGTPGDQLVPAGTLLNSAGTNPEFSLTAGQADEAGEPVILCFEVTAGDTLEEQHKTSAQWTFEAESVVSNS